MAGLLYDLEAYDPGHYGRTYMFTVRIDKLPGLDLYVVSVSGLPGYQSGVLEQNVSNEHAKMAERPQLGEVSLVIHDNVSKKAAEQAWNWYKEVYDPASRRVGFPSQYKSDGELEQLDTKGQTIRLWRMQGLWPSAIELSEFNYDSSELVEITLTLQVDRVLL